MLSTLLALHLLASAQITPPPPPAEPTTLPATTPAPTWYGWQTLIADGAVILVTGTGFILATNGYAKPGNSIAGAGGGSYVIPAPIVHLVHGNVWGALGSFGLKVLFGMGGMLLGVVLDVARHGLSSTYHLGELGVGLTVMMTLGAIVDAQRLAWEPTPANPPASKTPLVRMTPFMGVARGAPMAGLTGIF
ncbi:MAG TPA: hypothetical protein VFA20_16880 [Myxococcaceae bacterium]|nr:hypothetical protein [Myxococcaceae bacterium]